MFYSQIILAKKGPLGKIWLAAHWDKKLNKQQIFTSDIQSSVDSIVNPQVPLALRVSGHLLLGVVRIYSRKVKYLFTDCSEALVKIKLAFRPGVVDLPSNHQQVSAHTINVSNFGEFEAELTYSIDDITAPSLDEWISASSQTLARRQNITMADPMAQLSQENDLMDRDGMLTADSFGGGDWQAFDLDESIENSRRLSTISDIEVARKADTSGGFRELNESGLLLRTDEKSIAEYSNDDQPDLGVHDAYGDVQQDALELERSVDGPPSLSGQTLDISTDLNASLNNASRMSLDLALVNEEDNTKQIRPKKKRKIGRDSVTELSATFLNQAMADTSDITRPRDVTITRSKTSQFGYTSTGDLTASPDLFTKPFIQDLSEELLGMFKYTMKKRKYPFESNLNADEDDIEQTRRMSEVSGRLSTRESMASGNDSLYDTSFDGDKPVDFNESTSQERALEDIPEYDYGALLEADNVDGELEDLNLDIDLAPVNDLQGNIDQSIDESYSTAQHKWHPHTAKVMHVLRQSLGEKESVTYNQLTKKTQTRRTAAALFFEILQLKTLNYVDLEQSKPYGDIKIVKADRFSETIPAVDGAF